MDRPARRLTTAIAAAAIIAGGGIAAAAMEGPDSVTLDSLAQYYKPVTFNHTLHVDVTENNCATCHHHTTGTAVKDPKCLRCHAKSGEADEVTCQGCHAANRFDSDYLKKISADINLYHTGKVGLKGAYHLKCLGCHQEMGAPTGCEDCHTRTEAGDKLFKAGAYTPAATADSGHGGH